MADKCKKCEAEFTATRDVFKCKDCGGSFHLHCVGKVKRNSTRCESCTIEISSAGSRVSDSTAGARDGAVLEAIAALRSDLTDRADQQLEKLNYVQDTLNKVVSDVTALKAQYTELKVVSDNVLADVSRLQSDNAGLSRKVMLLENVIADLQQHSRKSNVLITGVPVTQREDILAILASIASAIQVEFHPWHVSAAHRLPAGSDDKRPPSIIVNFVSRLQKMTWIRARRGRRSLLATDINAAFPESQIYINEQLTQVTRDVFNAARMLVKERKLDAVWTSDCRVLAKRTPTGPPFRIHSLRQLKGISGKGETSKDSEKSPNDKYTDK